MNTDKLDTIEGRAELIQMHAAALRMQLLPGDFPTWRTKAERELDVAEKLLADAMSDILAIKGQIRHTERSAA